MNPATFREEYSRLTTELTAAEAVTQRLQDEVDQCNRAAAAGAPSPSYTETVWLLAHQRTTVQNLKQARDRLMTRRRHAIDAAFIALAKQTFPKSEVERLERIATDDWRVPA